MFSAPPGQVPVPAQDNTWLLVAIVLGIFVGGFGVHRMYLGHTSSGITMLVLTLIGIATACLIVGYFLILAVWIWSIVDVISIATGNLRPVRPI
jgi:TM2 domain-containing membrane protein YozV